MWPKWLAYNKSNLSGAIDIIVVKQKDGSFISTPFHVRFGKFQLLRANEKVVHIEVNGTPIDFLQLRLGEAGEAYFISEEISHGLSEGSPPLSTLVSERLNNNSVPSALISIPNTPSSSPPSTPSRSIWRWPWGSLPQRKSAPRGTLIESNAAGPASSSDSTEHKKHLDDLFDESSDEESEEHHGDYFDDKVPQFPWGVGALYRLFKTTEEPVYLIRPIENDLYLRICELYGDDDEDELEDEFYSMISPREIRITDENDIEKFQPKVVDKNKNKKKNKLGKNKVKDHEGIVLWSPRERKEENEHIDPNKIEKVKKEEKLDEGHLPDSEFSLSKEESLPPSLANSPVPRRAQLYLNTPGSNSPDMHDPSLENDTQWMYFVNNTLHEKNKASAANNVNVDELEKNKINKTDIISDDVEITVAKESGEIYVSDTQTGSSTTTTTSTTSPHIVDLNEKDGDTITIDVNAADIVTDNTNLVEKEVEMSRCKNLLQKLSLKNKKQNNSDVSKSIQEAAEVDRIFRDHIVSFDDFCANPGSVIADPNLVFKIENKIYPLSIALPILLGKFAFHQSLSHDVVKRLEEDEAKKSIPKRGWRNWFGGGTKIPANGNDIKPTKKYVRTLRPTSEELALLNLRPGENRITFTVESELRGKQQVAASIYLWDIDSKIVISDIDGTITKSDLFGHIMPILGRDWSHSGVAQLYSNIVENGYKILYCSSRPIGQAHFTRGYINTLKQDDVSLPAGPVFTSPAGLLESVNREIIKRNPEEFKITCLKDILSLFPGNRTYYAGFGNKLSDAISYRAVGVTKGKIFTINKAGEIRITNKMYKKSYIKLNDLVNEMFPTINRSGIHEEYNNFQFWKTPIANLEDALES